MNRAQVFSKLETKYEDWLKGLKQNGFAAANHYVANLKAIGDPVAPHNANTAKWCGLFELLTGKHPDKGVFDVSGVAEFATLYGAAVSFFTAEKGEKEKIRPLYPNCKCFDDLFDFAYNSGNANALGDGGHTRSGFVKYCQFLCELESQITDDVVKLSKVDLKSLQQIYFGAPGTGKSHDVNEITEKMPKEDVVRTTFHPDSDYSTFVGAYKPKMEKLPRTIIDGMKIEKITQGDADLLTEKKISYEFVPQAFAKAYVQAWKRFAEGGGAAETMTDQPKTPTGIDAKMVEVANALIAAKGVAKGCEVRTGEIIDKFVELAGEDVNVNSIIPTDYCYNRVNGDYSCMSKPKLFEYVSYGKFKCWGENHPFKGDVMARPRGEKADKKVGTCANGVRTITFGGIAPVMLVIEEINRGDCAKAFGDLFQLLDRKDGFSEYPILADADFADYIRGALTASEKAAIIAAGYASVVADKNLELILPANFYIWATMNTSDQSLSPMDSAFKRRWDWKCVPIKNEKKGWTIKFDVPPKADGQPTDHCEYAWWDFLKKINAEVLKYTSSEDKQLGYYFVKPEGTEIDAEMFVNKVVFFLWNAVFKDCYTECDYLKDGDDYYTFTKFFNDDGSVDKAVVKKVLDELMKGPAVAR